MGYTKEHQVRPVVGVPVRRAEAHTVDAVARCQTRAQVAVTVEEMAHQVPQRALVRPLV